MNGHHVPLKISLPGQIEELDYELGQRRHVYPRLVATRKRRQGECDYHMNRLEAARATLAWLAAHEAEFRAFLALPAGSRATILAHPDNVLMVQQQIAAAERRAANGGPVR